LVEIDHGRAVRLQVRIEKSGRFVRLPAARFVTENEVETAWPRRVGPKSRLLPVHSEFDHAFSRVGITVSEKIWDSHLARRWIPDERAGDPVPGVDGKPPESRERSCRVTARITHPNRHP